MTEFNASRTMKRVRDRAREVQAGEHFIPSVAAIVAVLAALATLFSNHNSILGIQARTNSVLAMTQASDKYTNYETKRIRIEVNRALLQADLVANPNVRNQMRAKINDEAKKSDSALKDARNFEALSANDLERSDRSMGAFERHEVASTLFEVSIVLVSITAIMRQSRTLLYVAAGTTFVGLIFFALGLLR